MHFLCSHHCSLSTLAILVEFWLEFKSFLKNFKVIFLCPQSGLISVNTEHLIRIFQNIFCLIHGSEFNTNCTILTQVFRKKNVLILDNIWYSCHCDPLYVSASLHQQKNEISNSQKYSRLRCLLRVKYLVICNGYLSLLYFWVEHSVKWSATLLSWWVLKKYSSKYHAKHCCTYERSLKTKELHIYQQSG